MILKYTLRLIKSTLNRFIAILAIVFIGVSFMMGLRSNYNIMQNSVEEYESATLVLLPILFLSAFLVFYVPLSLTLFPLFFIPFFPLYFKNYAFIIYYCYW